MSSLVTMLVQTDKFGTSVAQSLRVHSETLRTKRRQRAEEAAAKTGVKMVFPLVFCIFPAIWVVTIGPAAIRFVTVLVPLVEELEIAPTRVVMALIARNLDTGAVVADNVAVADTHATRAVGLLNRSGLNPGEGAVDRAEPRRAHLVACASPSTCVALDDRGVVVDSVSHAEAVARSACRGAAPPACWSCPPARSTRPAPRSGTIRIELVGRGEASMSARCARAGGLPATPSPTQPPPPAPPATIAETGLHPDSLAQLLLKTLVGGEATGTGLADSCGCRTRCSRRSSSTRGSRSWSKCAAPPAPAPPAIATR